MWEDKQEALFFDLNQWPGIIAYVLFMSVSESCRGKMRYEHKLSSDPVDGFSVYGM